MPLFNSNIDLDQNQLKGAVIHSGSSKPNNGAEVAGQIFYDTDVNQLQVYNGSIWQGLATETVDTDDIFNVGLRIGRDSHNMFDFETADNTIDVYLNNAKDFTFTANTFTAQSGSTIAGQVITGTTIDATTDFTIGNLVITDNTLTGTAMAIAGGSGEIDLTTTGALDLNSGALTIDSSTMSIDGTGDSNITVTGSAKDLNLVVAGGGTQELRLLSAGTGASALDLTTSAGGMDINSADMITIDAADEIVVTTTSADGHISLVSAHTAGQAIHLDGNANAGSIVDIDAGILDIDVTAGITMDGTTVSIDGTDTSNLTVTGSGKNLSVGVTGGGEQELKLGSAGTSAAAVNIDATAGGVDVDAVTNIALTTTGNAGEIQLISAHTAGRAVFIDANANAGSIVDIDAGILDIDVTGAASITSGGELVLNAAGLDIDSSSSVTFDVAGAASDILISTAHTAGTAFKLDANANAGSIVDIDAGILDIDVTGVTTFDTTEFKLASAGGLRVTDVTASSATEGGAITLVANDGAAMADDHRIGVINFFGAEDASSTLTRGAAIEAFCDAGWSASENGARLVFSTTDANNDTDIALTLDSNQKASFGADVAIAGNLTVAGTTTTENTTIIESTVTVLQFEGANANNHETILKVVEPAADTTLSLPALSAGNFFIPAIAGAATDASAAVTAAEFALLDGGSTVGTTAISDNDGIVSNDAGTMRHTKVQTYQTYFDANSVGGGNIVTTGALGTGTIAAGFGAIDNGTSGIRTNIFTAETSFLPDADDGATLGSANLNFSDVFLADGAVLNFGDDQDVKLTHVADAGILLNDAMKIQFNDASQFIQGSSATELQISATDQINLDSTLIDLNGNLDVSGTALITGVLTVASNIVHASDTNNLIAFDTDTQSFQTGGTARMNISDSGLQIGGGARVTTVLDEDAMGTDSATALATQQSIKKYVDDNTATNREVVLVLNNSVTGVASTDNVTYKVTHSLNTRNVMVEVIRNGANSGDFRTVYVDVHRSTDDVVDIVFGSARTAGDYTVMIQKIG